MESDSKHSQVNQLKVVDIGISTHNEPIAYLREDSYICRAEGFSANSRVLLITPSCKVIATLNVVDCHVLPKYHIGLSKIALQQLQVLPGDRVTLQHPAVVKSISAVRKKMFKHKLTDEDLQNIISDICEHRYSDIEVACFLSVCAGNHLNKDEIIGLTKAMVNVGERLTWSAQKPVFDKHCIGGLPGNRTSPLVVSIVSAAGHIMPKTSSRAITSPAGTADAMDTLTHVDLSLRDMQQVVKDTNACLAWGAAVNLSPADDLLIRIEKALDLDSEGQLIASVLSKKIAAGSKHILIDIPVGPTAKVRSEAQANRLIRLFTEVGDACGVHIRCVVTDGSKPVGHGIGPVEEARDVLTVLQCSETAPQDLRQRALLLSAHLLDMAENCGIESGLKKAESLLDTGKAYQQFKRILIAQGGIKTLSHARFSSVQAAKHSGLISAVDNRRLARLAKLAGAPLSPGAGLRLHANTGDKVYAGQPLFTLLSDSQGELDYALGYYADNADIFSVKKE